ncbi:MAG: hypothetical protein KC503_34165 [Myxococcales bacterium]|nr:hypothetical protein [Myxococcales bacterium]
MTEHASTLARHIEAAIDAAATTTPSSAAGCQAVLAALLSAYRHTPRRELADAIDQLTARYADSLPRLDETLEGSAYHDAWMARAKACSDYDVPLLLAGLFREPLGDRLAQRAALLMRRPADPRINAAFVAMLCEPPALAQSMFRKLWTPMFAHLVKCGDTRGRGPLAQRLELPYGGESNFWPILYQRIRTNLQRMPADPPPLDETLSARVEALRTLITAIAPLPAAPITPPAPPSARALREQARARAAAEKAALVRRGADIPRDEAIEAQILADPEQVAPYSVYADWLSSRGSAWGELMSHQLAFEAMLRERPDDHAAHQKAERALERVTKRAVKACFAYLGQLHELVTWRRGFADALAAGPWYALDQHAEALGQLLREPWCRLLRDLALAFEAEAPWLLDVLPALGRLRSLSLRGSELAHVQPIAALASLEALALENCGRPDLAALQDARRLRRLEIDFSIFDDAAAEMLPELESLSVRIPCPDVRPPPDSPLWNLTHLARQRALVSLTLGGSRSQPHIDLGPLAKLSTLRHLAIRDAALRLETLSAPRSLERLTLDRLWAQDEAALDLSALGELGALRELELDTLYTERPISLQWIGKLTKLRKLTLDEEQIVDLSGLEELSALRELELRVSADLEPLGALAIETLVLAPKRRIRLGPLAKIASLRRLELSGDITHVTPLCQLPQLEELDIRYLWDSAERFAPLTKCVSLRSVRLDVLDDRHVGWLRALPALERIVARRVEASDLDALLHAPRLSRVVIEGTLDRATRGKVRTLTSALEKRALAARAHRR